MKKELFNKRTFRVHLYFSVIIANIRYHFMSSQCLTRLVQNILDFSQKPFGYIELLFLYQHLV